MGLVSSLRAAAWLEAPTIICSLESSLGHLVVCPCVQQCGDHIAKGGQHSKGDFAYLPVFRIFRPLVEDTTNYMLHGS